MAARKTDSDERINIQDAIVHTIPDTLFHKGTAVRLTGKVAMEVEDVKTGKKAWVRHVDTVAKPAPKPEPAKKATKVAAKPDAAPAKRTTARKRSAK